MISWKKGVLGAAMALASSSAMAQDGVSNAARPSRWAGSEIAVGVLQHGSNFHPLGEELIFDLPALPPGQIYEGSEEDGTVDVQVVYRSAPLNFALHPRLTGKLQINTAGRTSFASIGAEWRRHLPHSRIYGQVGVGLTVHDGYDFTPNPFEPGLTQAQAQRRYDIYRDHISFGSQVLFNPNAAVGVQLTPRWALEATWEHFSHAQIFSEQNPGMDTLGLRLVRTLGPGR